MKTFINALEMAKWIKANIVDEFKQEIKMLEGIQYKKFNGVYMISI